MKHNRSYISSIALTIALCTSVLASTAPPLPRPFEGDPGLWEKQLVLPPSVLSRLAWAKKSLTPSGMEKLERLAFTLAPGIASGASFPALRQQAERGVVSSCSGMAGMDVSEAAFIVLAMATKDMDDDIRLIMAEIKAMSASKQQLRERIKELNDWISKEMSKTGDKASDLENSPISMLNPHAAGTLRSGEMRSNYGIILQKSVSPIIHLEYVRAPRLPQVPLQNYGSDVVKANVALNSMKGQLNSLLEAEEMMYRVIGTAVDRRSKFIETLSRTMEKIGTVREVQTPNAK